MTHHSRCIRICNSIILCTIGTFFSLTASLKQQIKNLILPWFDCPNQLFESGNCDAFSIYLASQLPVPVLWRLNLFSMNNVVNRLRTTLKYLNRYNALRCLQCETVITHYSNIFR